MQGETKRSVFNRESSCFRLAIISSFSIPFHRFIFPLYSRIRCSRFCQGERGDGKRARDWRDHSGGCVVEKYREKEEQLLHGWLALRVCARSFTVCVAEWKRGGKHTIIPGFRFCILVRIFFRFPSSHTTTTTNYNNNYKKKNSCHLWDSAFACIQRFLSL